MRVTFPCKPTVLQRMSSSSFVNDETHYFTQYLELRKCSFFCISRSFPLLCSLSRNQNEAVALCNCCEMRKASKTCICKEELLLSQQIKDAESVVLASTGEPE